MLFLNILIAKHALLCNESIHPFTWSLLPAHFYFLSGNFLTGDKSLYFMESRGKEWPEHQYGLEVGCNGKIKSLKNLIICLRARKTDQCATISQDQEK